MHGPFFLLGQIRSDEFARAAECWVIRVYRDMGQETTHTNLLEYGLHWVQRESELRLDAVTDTALSIGHEGVEGLIAKSVRELPDLRTVPMRENDLIRRAGTQEPGAFHRSDSFADVLLLIQKRG